MVTIKFEKIEYKAVFGIYRRSCYRVLTKLDCRHWADSWRNAAFPLY